MKERVFINEKMRKRLEESLYNTADYLTNIGGIVKTNFKGAKWCTAFLWALDQYPDLRNYYCQKLYKDTAEALGLDCWIDAGIVPTEKVRLNRHIVEIQIAASQKAIKEYKINPEIRALLCTGAIYIDNAGAVRIATNAADMITEYCSVFVESAKEKAFIKSLTALQNAAGELEKCYQAFNDQVNNAEAKNSINWRSRDFNINKLCLCDNLPLVANSTLWRAFVSLCLPERQKDAPHFYNRVGVPKISVAELWELSGYLPAATPELCVKFPELYPVSALKMTAEESKEAIRIVKEKIKQVNTTLDERGQIVRNSKFVQQYATIYPEID